MTTPEQPQLESDQPGTWDAAGSHAGIALECPTIPPKHESLSLVDCAVRAASAPNLDVRSATLRRVTIEGSKLTGAGVTDLTASDLQMTECKADLVRLFDVRISNSVFESCDLRELYIERGSLERVVFLNCDLLGAQLSGALLRDVDLRGSRIEGITLDPRGLGSVTIDPTQAPALAAAMGVKVLNLGE